AEAESGPSPSSSSRGYPISSSSSRGYPMLRVVGVSVSQPMVPDRDDESGALVVLSAGCWTAGELTGIAEACADAGHEVVGIVLAGTVRARPSRSADRPRDAATPALAAREHATEGSG
ncbi:polysaccharide biosynthesis protein, partial [Streptomyces sp. NBS 14/10]